MIPKISAAFNFQTQLDGLQLLSDCLTDISFFFVSEDDLFVTKRDNKRFGTHRTHRVLRNILRYKGRL